MDGGKNTWFQPFAHARNFPRNLGNHVILVFFRVRIMHNCVILVFFCVMATCSDSDDKFSSALILRIIYTSEEYSNWKPWRNGRVANVLLFLRDAVRWCINYGASLWKIIEKLTSRMLKRLKPGVLSAICERRGMRLPRHVALSLVLAVAHKPHIYMYTGIHTAFEGKYRSWKQGCDKCGVNHT